MRSALAFTPGRSPLHRAPLPVSLGFLTALSLVAFLYSNPLVLAADGLAAAGAGLAAGAGRAVRAALRLGLTLLALMVAINALVYHRGETVLVRGWELPVIGGTDVTLESLAWGGMIGLRIAVVVLIFAIYSHCIDPDRVLRALRPLARRSTLTAALAVRMVPVAAGDAARLREAAELRGPAAEPVGRAALLRRLVEGSLDRAVDVAATLELRGHALDRPVEPRRERRRPHLGLAAAAVAIGALGLGGVVAGIGAAETFPVISIEADAGTLALAAAQPLLAVAPFARGRRG